MVFEEFNNFTYFKFEEILKPPNAIVLSIKFPIKIITHVKLLKKLKFFIKNEEKT